MLAKCAVFLEEMERFLASDFYITDALLSCWLWDFGGLKSLLKPALLRRILLL